MFEVYFDNFIFTIQNSVIQVKGFDNDADFYYDCIILVWEAGS